ncbi:bifunctional demethylmenaquinone methyltransferase/2-methoxy-6-polyprenyl-1,4-benzoquinol methylase UbiE [Vicingaceae bacterium]|nr:bifunctional demethylmenaquinone methyltransferase/2-methoxy-6-polyprenyl-1,4-benzoquinol methylase UbiE [Vicingaceae bacterium]MDC1451177.1 bifunctional demethylmenaquinone methyltransferase/2-methoxy-6-polyprenyl-1,4-benzoquinol methylase UbiE [Vicingaceae bacterium]
MAETVTPYKEKNSSKKEQVAEMFDNISHRYDFLNHFLSIGIDKLWRKKAVKILSIIQPKVILDVATGTGDFAIESLSLKPTQVVGIDISQGMLDKGIIKIKKNGQEDIIELKYGDSEDIPFEDNYFDAITVAFGVRNFEDLEKGLSEMKRVLKTGGMAVVLEFSKPKSFPIKQIYNFYFHKVLPSIGKLVSKDASAYTYLPESVEAFPEGKEFEAILKKVGFQFKSTHPLFFGISSIYVVQK